MMSTAQPVGLPSTFSLREPCNHPLTAPPRRHMASGQPAVPGAAVSCCSSEEEPPLMVPPAPGSVALKSMLTPRESWAIAPLYACKADRVRGTSDVSPPASDPNMPLLTYLL